MLQKLDINVSKRFIDYATQQKDSYCAIAVALKVHGMTRPRVRAESIAFTDPRSDQRYYFNTPDKIKKFIEQFDQDRKSVKPIRITFDAEKADKILKSFKAPKIVKAPTVKSRPIKNPGSRSLRKVK